MNIPYFIVRTRHLRRDHRPQIAPPWTVTAGSASTEQGREKLGGDKCSETDKDPWPPPRVSGFLSPDIFKLSFSRELYAPVLQHAGPDQVTALARGRSYLMFCPIKSFDHGQPHFRKMCWKEFEQILTDHIPDSSNIGYIVSPLLKCSFRNFTVHCDAHLLFTTSASVA